MSLIQRQEALVKELEKAWRRQARCGYAGLADSVIGMRSKAMRLHAEAMIRDGYTKKDGWDSARQCDDVARLNVNHEQFMQQMGAPACGIPTILAQALAHFAPASSAVHQDAKEAQAVRADLHINRLKSGGELRRREDARALADQIQWGAA
jgi:hypothetical protein